MLNRLSVRELCKISLLTAFICVLAQISIPMPYGVPMTLQTFAVPFAAVILGPKKGTIAAVVYVLLGAVGVPVFANFTGGLSIVFGPTGGFILSFPIMALLAGIGASKNNSIWLWSGLVIGAAVNYLCGMLMFSLITGHTLAVAFAGCILPFLPTSVVKILLVGFVGVKFRRILEKSALA